MKATKKHVVKSHINPPGDEEPKDSIENQNRQATRKDVSKFKNTMDLLISDINVIKEDNALKLKYFSFIFFQI